MSVKITFLGAAQNVTGSRYLIETDNNRILIDCGMHQERQLRERDWNPFPVSPGRLDAVLLTHAHLDHCGLIPKLVREGCKCPVYSTDATAELTKIILLDSASLQEEDAEFKKTRHMKEGRVGHHPEVPLYTVRDVEACLSQFISVPYRQKLVIDDEIEATFYDAGHILGSSIIKIRIKQGDEYRTILFSGDLGRLNSPILEDPDEISNADYVVIESTYGERLHGSRDESLEEFATAINATTKAGGNIVMPVFALQRSQDILYYLNKLLLEDRVPHLAVFLDSPMAVNITNIYKNHSDLFDEEMKTYLHNGTSPFSFSNLHFTASAAASKEINHIKGTVIIMAGSGMCTGGRIKHHLVSNISRPESTILFPGYQASGTLGRQIVDGSAEVRIMGQMYPVRARIVQIDGFSAHADRDGLIKWLEVLKKPPRRVFVTHGESGAIQAFSETIKERLGYNVTAPSYLDQFSLD